jgi:hypothetical protein
VLVGSLLVGSLGGSVGFVGRISGHRRLGELAVRIRPQQPATRPGDVHRAGDDPFPDSVPVVTDVAEPLPERRERWRERIRGALGLAGIILGSGILLALSIGVLLLAIAIAIATIFN